MQTTFLLRECYQRVNYLFKFLKPGPEKSFFVSSYFFYIYLLCFGQEKARDCIIFEIGVAPMEDVEEQRSEEHTSELQSRPHLVCRLLLEKKKKKDIKTPPITDTTQHQFA